MWTAMKRGFVLTKSVNAFQDGIHRRIAIVSTKNQCTYVPIDISVIIKKKKISCFGSRICPKLIEVR